MDQRKLLVGSIETIIGHTEGAAGLAGVLKVVQSLDENWIIQNLHLDSINPEVLPFCDHLKVLNEPTCWGKTAPGHPRRASVNSFGFGGTNAHAIIEKYEPHIHNTLAYLFNSSLSNKTQRPLGGLPEAARETEIALPMVFSGASPKSLIAVLERYAVFLKENPNKPSELLAWQLFNHQTTHAVRKVVVVDNADPTATMLSLVEANRATKDQLSGVIRARQLHNGSPPRILGIFTGQGAQYAAMSKGLFRINSVYRDTIKVLDSVLQSCPDPPAWSILGELMKDQETSLIHTAEVLQVLCCALQVGLVNSLSSIGVTFKCVLGHSSGEIGAAYAAGRITQRDAILVSYYRGKSSCLAAGNNGVKSRMAACGMSESSRGVLLASEVQEQTRPCCKQLT